MKYTQAGNCPYCDAERGINTPWAMHPYGMALLKTQHDAGHPSHTTPTSAEVIEVKCNIYRCRCPRCPNHSVPAPEANYLEVGPVHCYTCGKEIPHNEFAAHAEAHRAAPVVEEKGWKNFDMDKFFKDTDEVGKILHPEHKTWEMSDIISGALMDGQNQIHDLHKGKATPEEITERTQKAYDFWIEKAAIVLAHAKEEGRKLGRQEITNSGYHQGFAAAQKETVELIAAYKEYINFLGEQIEKDASYLRVHSMSASNEVVEKGIELRAKIAALEAALTPEQPPKDI